jgi:hypothetical protein
VILILISEGLALTGSGRRDRQRKNARERRDGERGDKRSARELHHDPSFN